MYDIVIWGKGCSVLGYRDTARSLHAFVTALSIIQSKNVMLILNYGVAWAALVARNQTSKTSASPDSVVRSSYKRISIEPSNRK